MSKLDWLEDTKPQAKIDLVLCADVIYNPELVPWLVGVIHKISRRTLMANVIRNSETYRVLLTNLKEHQLSFTKLADKCTENGTMEIIEIVQFY